MKNFNVKFMMVAKVCGLIATIAFAVMAFASFVFFMDAHMACTMMIGVVVSALATLSASVVKDMIEARS